MGSDSLKNILFLAPIEPNGRYNGGIASYASAISADNYFNKEQIKFYPLSTCQIKRDAFSGGKIRFKNFINFFRLRKAVSKALKQTKIDMIYLNTSRNFALLKDILLLKKKYKKMYDIVIHIHFADFNEVFHKNKFIRWFTLRKLKRLSPRIISLSSKLKEELIKNGFSPNKIYVLRNYYSPLLIKTTSPNNSDKQHITNYIFVGSITKRKGIDLLLDVFSVLNNDFQLFVCGTPNEKEGEDMIKKYSYKTNIHFVGFVNGDKKNLMFSNSDVFVLPTLAEGLPISILEAMFFGLGIITTSVGAISEIVGNDNGFVIQPGDKEKLRECIIKYHHDADLLKKHKSNNLNISAFYSYDIFRKNLIEIINDNGKK